MAYCHDCLLVKRPKLYFGDTGLLCHLLRLESPGAVAASPFAGAIFENLALLEMLKSQVNRGSVPEIYYFRDRQGLEVDFLMPIQVVS